MTLPLRRILVLLHMMAAFGWLTASIAVLLLAWHDEHAAATLIDDRLLADCSFMTVYTGLMLAGLTRWGYVRFWWVTVKLVLALGFALGGRAMLAGPVSRERLVAATLLTIAAIATMAWIARAKPWGRLSKGPARPWDHPALYAVVILAPALDYITDLPLQAIPAAVVLTRHAHATLTRT